MTHSRVQSLQPVEQFQTVKWSQTRVKLSVLRRGTWHISQPPKTVSKSFRRNFGYGANNWRNATWICPARRLIFRYLTVPKVCYPGWIVGDLIQDPIRNELVPLYADLKHLMAKRNEQELEERNKLTPAQEMEKLTRQLKHDNQAILTMEKQIGAVEERVNRLTDDLRNMESDLDESYLQKIKVCLRIVSWEIGITVTWELSEKSSNISRVCDKLKKSSKNFWRATQTMCGTSKSECQKRRRKWRNS